MCHRKRTALAGPLHHSYQSSKPVQWAIAQRTLTHMASERLNKLSEARQLSGYREDYDPNTYMVSRAALLAQPSPRLDELATPLPRRMLHTQITYQHIALKIVTQTVCSIALSLCTLCALVLSR